MPNFKRGAAAIHEVVEARSSSGGGTYRPWLRQIFWNKDNPERYVLILNSMDEFVCVKYHPFIETDNGPRQIIARTDAGVEPQERVDPIEAKWGYAPRDTNLLIAVELEPTFKDVNGRQKVSGFSVVLDTVERRVRNDDGELTEDKEEIDVPAIGYIAQSPHNFGNLLVSYQETEGDIDSVPFKIKKVGEGTSVTYQLLPYEGVEVDLTNLLEYLGNVAYINNPEEIFEVIDGLDDVTAAKAVGSYLLDKKLEELVDLELYNEIFDAISKPSRFAKDKADVKPPTNQASARRTRPTTRSNNEEEVPKARARKNGEETTQVSRRQHLAALREQVATKDAA